MSLGIDGVERAANLGDEERRTIEALIEVNAKHAQRNRVLVDYYEGDANPREIGLQVVPDSVQVPEFCDWPRKAVTSVAERSRFSGFVFEDGSEDEDLNRIVIDNDLIGAYNRHVHSELIHGCMFATVNQYGGICRIRFHTAETSAAIFDDEAGRIGSGLVIAETARTSWSLSDPVPVQVNLHLPGLVVVLERTGTATWVADYRETPLDRPAMEAFAYLPTGLKPFGETRISKTVRSITDDVIRTLRNMAVSSAFYSSPQKYLIGLSDAQYDAMMGAGDDEDEDGELTEEQQEANALRARVSKWNAYITNMLVATRDEDGNIPEFGQLTAASPEPYIAVLRTYATLFSGATGVPLNSLGIVQDNPSSAEAIDAAREDICICAQNLNQSNGQSLRNVALMAMAQASDTSIDGLSDVQRTVMAKFLDPSMPSVVSQADAATKIAASAAWFVQTDEYLRLLGFDEATIRQLRSARAVGNAQTMLASFRPAATATTPAVQTAEA